MDFFESVPSTRMKAQALASFKHFLLINEMCSSQLIAKITDQQICSKSLDEKNSTELDVDVGLYTIRFLTLQKCLINYISMSAVQNVFRIENHMMIMQGRKIASLIWRRRRYVTISLGGAHQFLNNTGSRSRAFGSWSWVDILKIMYTKIKIQKILYLTMSFERQGYLQAWKITANMGNRKSKRKW